MKKLDGLSIAMQIAVERGGKCLSTEYIGNHDDLEWECKEKHRWFASLNNVKDKKTWCGECFGNIKYTIEFCQEVARRNRGWCLSDEYINLYEFMKWKCRDGHIWNTRFTTIINDGCWCPGCAGTKKLDGLEIAKRIAKERGGRCLSKKYINSSDHMHWECAKKHKWWATLNKVKDSNQWCRKCSYLKQAKSSNNIHTLYHWKTGEELICIASYEKAVVGYLNANKINFRWQSKTFEMPNGKTYRPDMYLFSTKRWIEIKGYFRKDAEEKWDWFKKEYGNSELWDERKLKQMRII